MSHTADSDRGAVAAIAVVGALVLLSVAAVAGLGLADVSDPSGDEILDDAEQRYESADTIAGAATVTAVNDTQSREYNVSFTLGQNNTSRMSVTGENRTVVAGNNGTVAWIHDERTGITRVVSNESHGANTTESNATAEGWNASTYDNRSVENATDRLETVVLDWTEENTTATRDGRETIDGTDAWVVAVEPENETREGSVTHWVGVDSSKVLRSEYDRPNATVTVDYTDTRFNVSVADSTFEPPDSAGGPVFDAFGPLQNATTITVPELDNESYTFEEGRVAGFGGETAVTTYDGPANVTLVATTADPDRPDDGNTTTEEVAGVTVNVTETDDGVVVTWERADRTVSLFTDAPRKTALDLAGDTIEGTDVSESESEA